MNRKTTGIIIVAVSILITFTAAALSFSRQGGMSTGLAGTKRAVAVIYLTGTIAFGDQSSILQAGTSTDQTMRALERAEKDRSLRAVVIRINSPGGSAAASQELYEQVLRLKSSGKKVVASFGDIATSGGYYVGVAADRIVANPSTITGSIGVIATVPNLQELYRKIGYQEQTFKSGAHKDMFSPNRPVTSEERNIIQGIIDETFSQFVKAVAEGRNLPLSQVRSLADGRIFTGSQAKRLGLVDDLGGLQEAIRIAAKLADIKGEPEVIEYRSSSFLNYLKAFSSWKDYLLFPYPLPSSYITINY